VLVDGLEVKRRGRRIRGSKFKLLFVSFFEIEGECFVKSE